MSKVELISLTPDAEKTMAYIARVSNPNNQKNEDYSRLLSYCIKNEHWSVFEQSFMTLQIETNRGIAAQILRHRSCLLYTSPSPRDRPLSRMPSSA